MNAYPVAKRGISCKLTAEDMLRLIIIAVILYGVYYVGSSMMGSYKDAERQSGISSSSPPTSPSARRAPAPARLNLEGLPHQLQASLDTAEAQGPAALKRWLEANRRYCRDPKLGDIELDYAVALMRQNSSEARATFRAVKARTPANSPLQPRLQQLSKTFE